MSLQVPFHYQSLEEGELMEAVLNHGLSRSENWNGVFKSKEFSLKNLQVLSLGELEDKTYILCFFPEELSLPLQETGKGEDSEEQASYMGVPLDFVESGKGEYGGDNFFALLHGSFAEIIIKEPDNGDVYGAVVSLEKFQELLLRTLKNSSVEFERAEHPNPLVFSSFDDSCYSIFLERKPLFSSDYLPVGTETKVVVIGGVLFL